MRRLVFPVLLASGLVMVGAVPASAEPAPTASAKAAAGKKMCKITDPVLPELSGIVATKNGYVVVNDSTDQAAERKIFFLNTDCEITKKVDFPVRPRDPEDLVLSPDGKTLWIADIGDNATRDDTGEPRDTIALWSIQADGSKAPKIYRLTYPNGDKHDAEALLLDGNGRPIIVTREDVGKPAGIYTPTAALKAGSDTGVPLTKAGEIELPRTDTPGSAFARLAQGIVTGGAVSPGGGKVVLRTYLDAFEWDVSNGDVVAALKTKPRGTGLQTDLFGEAITYSADGKYFYTVSDMGTIDDEDAANYILRYTPATKVIEANTAATDEDGTTGSGTSWYADLSLTDITYMVAGIGALGALLVGAGVIGIMRSRKRRPLEAAAKDPDPTGPEPLDAETELLTVGGPQTGVYGGNRPMASAGAAASGPGTPVIAGAAASGPGVYGAKPGPAAGPKGNGVYGGGRPPQGGQPANRPGAGGRPGQGGPGGSGQGAPGGRPGPDGAAGGGAPQGGPAGRPGAPVGRPGAPGAPAGRPGAPGAPAGRPGAPGAPAGRPGAPGAPAGRPGAPGGRPVAGRPGQAGPSGGPGPGAPQGRPGQGGGPGQGVANGRPGQGGAGRPAQGGPASGGPASGGPGGGSGQGAPGGRPGQGGPGGGRAPQGGPPAGRPSAPAGRPGAPAGRPGAPAGRPGAPAGRPGAPADRPGAPAGHPGQGGAPAGRPAQGGAAGGRPPQGGQPGGRPVPGGGQPGRPGGGQPPARPAQGGGQPAARPAQGGQPGGRPVQGGGQPGARTGGQPGARPGQGGGKSGGGVYGAPPPATGRPGGGAQRPSGFFGQGPGGGAGQPGGQQPGRPDGGRQSNNFGNLNGPARGPEGDLDAPGYGRNQPGR